MPAFARMAKREDEFFSTPWGFSFHFSFIPSFVDFALPYYTYCPQHVFSA
jgi:hypothetical protein